MCNLLIAVVFTFLLRFSAVQCTQTFGCTYDPDLDHAPVTEITGVPAYFSATIYPSKFHGGLGCRWTSDTEDSFLSCAYELPQHPTCDEDTPDRIEVTTVSGEVYYHCGMDNYVVLPQAMLLEMKTSPDGEGGYLFCNVVKY